MHHCNNCEIYNFVIFKFSIRKNSLPTFTTRFLLIAILWIWVLMPQEITHKLQQNDFLRNIFTAKDKLLRKVSAQLTLLITLACRFTSDRVQYIINSTMDIVLWWTTRT